MPTDPIKVAIVGGGCAAIAAAFELSRPEHHGKYAVTVYQVGWRLGGKGASGRGPSMRIEEHGLHMWLGCYENAFRLMRQCYRELDRDPKRCRIATWRDAFEPYPFLGISELAEGRPDEVWRLLVPVDDLEPGDPDRPSQNFTLNDYVLRVLNLLGALVRDLSPDAADENVRVAAVSETDLLTLVDRFVKYGETVSLTALHHLTWVLQIALIDIGRLPPGPVLELLNVLKRNVLAQLREVARNHRSAGRVWSLIDVTFATLRGIVSDGLLTDPRGLDAISDYDCLEWLLRHGAAPESVDSGYMRAMYDMVFAYEDGDSTRPRMDAGQAVRSIMRALLGYRGTFFWRMNAGMGDIVFAPFYEVLKRRGVRFEFFHRLERVELGETAPGERRYISALEMDVQATTVHGTEYAPLIDVDGLPCWPAHPRYELLADGADARRTGRDYESFWERHRVARKRLRVVDDFDAVVVAVGLGAIPHVCADIVESDPRWRAMVENVKTVATQSFQIWLNSEMDDVGWTSGQGYAVSGFVEPFDTWADMRHLLTEERWSTTPRALAYFCGVLPEVDLHRQQASGDDLREAHRRVVKDGAIRFLNGDLVKLWRKAHTQAGEFRWDLLTDGMQGSPSESNVGETRFDSQFWIANSNPSDRYVQSLPGTARFRISPLDETYANLTIAGDWTDCGLNTGCVEAAVMSGMLAAHAISGTPSLESIVAYDHP